MLKRSRTDFSAERVLRGVSTGPDEPLQVVKMFVGGQELLIREGYAFLVPGLATRRSQVAVVNALEQAGCPLRNSLGIASFGIFILL